MKRKFDPLFLYAALLLGACLVVYLTRCTPESGDRILYPTESCASPRTFTIGTFSLVALFIIVTTRLLKRVFQKVRIAVGIGDGLAAAIQAILIFGTLWILVR